MASYQGYYDPAHTPDSLIAHYQRHGYLPIPLPVNIDFSTPGFMPERDPPQPLHRETFKRGKRYHKYLRK